MHNIYPRATWDKASKMLHIFWLIDFKKIWEAESLWTDYKFGIMGNANLKSLKT